MTTSQSETHAASPRAVTAPGRMATTSRLRRTSQVALVAGTVLAVVAAFGPTWLVRVGVGVAIAAAIIACVSAWRELFGARRQHARDLMQVNQQHGHVLREERTRNAAVVDTLTRRTAEANVAIEGHRAVIEGQRSVIVTLRSEVAGLRAEGVDLKTQLDQRDTMITSLRQTVGSRDTELAALREAAVEVEPGPAIRHLPLRALIESQGNTPDADELGDSGSHLSVVDLRMLDVAMVLPNYEVDRRVG